MSKADVNLKELARVKSSEVKNGRRLQRNLIVLAISFVFLLTSFLSMANLQSSLNKKVRHYATTQKLFSKIKDN